MERSRILDDSTKQLNSLILRAGKIFPLFFCFIELNLHFHYLSENLMTECHGQSYICLNIDYHDKMQKDNPSQALMVHACNPSSLGG
jgi:hypothetical protein